MTRLKIVGWSFTLSLLIVVYLPALLARGMWFDGALYAKISQSLSTDFSQLWHLQWYAGEPFYEHPPVFFLIQGIWFKLFGNHYWTEGIFIFFILLLSLYVIAKIWQLLCKYLFFKYEQWDWLVACFWFIMSGVAWAYYSNLLEVVLTLLTLWNVYLLLALCCAIYHQQYNTKFYVYALLSPFVLLLSYLTKGPIGLYPLCVCGLFLLIIQFKLLQKIILLALYVIVCASMCYGVILYSSDSAKIYMTHYYTNQMYHVSVYRYGSFTEHLKHLLPVLDFLSIPFLLMLALGCAYRFSLFKIRYFINTFYTIKKYYKPIILCLFLALSASLPVLISPKISDYYFTPSSPLYALFIGGIIIIYLDTIGFLNYLLKKTQWILFLSGILFIVGISLSWHFAGSVAREKELFEVMDYINTNAKKFENTKSFYAYKKTPLPCITRRLNFLEYGLYLNNNFCNYNPLNHLQTKENIIEITQCFNVEPSYFYDVERFYFERYADKYLHLIDSAKIKTSQGEKYILVHNTYFAFLNTVFCDTLVLNNRYAFVRLK